MNKKSKKIDSKKEQEYNASEELVFEGEFEGSDALKKLREKLKKAIAEKQEYLNGWQRAKADFVNFKKDEEGRKLETVRFAKESVVAEILPVLDSFNMAKESAMWGEGLENIYKQFLSILKKNGFEESNPLGKDFNPSMHEAVEMVSSSEKKDGKVVEVVQNGYLLNKKIIRPSRVKVGKFEK